MQDVARLAGVSHQTVSRVLNNHPNVRPETRDRVRAAIAEMGYRRNSAARALVTSRSGTIGVLTHSSALYGPVLTLHSVEQAARAAGLFVSLASLRSDEDAVLSGALDHFLDQAVEGIIVIAPVPGVAQAAAALASRLPIVLVADSDQPDLHPVTVDQAYGARLATDHLLSLGHREVVHVSGLPSWFDAAARVRGWAQALADTGCAVPEPLVGDWTAESGAAIGAELARTDPPTAIFAANDLMALGLIRALTDAGLRVPEDVSVVGFDDSYGSGFFRPALTTVRQDFVELGRRCVERMLGLLGGDADDGRTVVRPDLVLRESTAAPRAARRP
ncbi:LacI family DNA-binding transcriptional regulator [Microlunatus panaciterrae]|uniref:DNA-binding LacI/PurR family transcriptional regulator n=1 Tax=Microlunatus panaciterrae TaxID=400768 RepID=A0ABS2RH53_9ACTN|nr:LacI family DNA-binding transcriptional regulator [Microlunatus panaciterrae]MBM7798003.1 DNA-binding LacI/PurR family transcriptional regulator [Microlunatus panaciterrae]